MLRVAGPSTRLGGVLAIALALAAALLASGCGSSDPESDLTVSEGEPVKLGDLIYNVQITRFLNPSDPEDKAYLSGQPPPANNQFYLGVFMQIENDADSAQQVATGFRVVDTEGTEFKPIPSHSLFALKPGAKVAADGELPEPETTAANGPIQGSMILFRVDEEAIQARPLTLRIPSPGGPVAEVELDI
jgi:hypothetical protein